MRKAWLIMRKIYRTHFLGIEFFFSIIIISIITFIFYHYIGFEIFQSTLTDIRVVLYGTLVALAGALLGFVITGLSVLLTAGTTPQIEKLKQSKHYKSIFTIFFSTSKYLGILFIASLLSLVFDKDSTPVIVLPLITLWALIIVIFRILRCLWVLEKIVGLHILKK